MERHNQQYIRLLEKELVPAFGCTEPIAIAYAAAYAREVLGAMPKEVDVKVSSNIIKNVKSVTIPNTGGMKGIEAAAAAGIAAGDPQKKLEVISAVTEEQIPLIRKFLEQVPVRVSASENDEVFDIRVSVKDNEKQALVRIVREHMNIVYVEKDGKTVFQKTEETGLENTETALTIEQIVEFANEAAIDEIRPLIRRQIDFNMAIAREGIAHEYGGSVGRTILSHSAQTPADKARAYAAAGSDARMSGCTLPVIIVSGSGNQGITASVPIAVYAAEKGFDEEKMIRAVALSDLLTIYQRQFIGRLSAYCGAVNAGCASAAGIAYLEGGGFEEVAHTLINSLAAVSGVICDGAKPSCAAKIAASVEAGLLGYDMFRDKKEFVGGDGIVTCDADETIKNVGILGKEGMRQTDRKIIEIMLQRTESRNHRCARGTCE